MTYGHFEDLGAWKCAMQPEDRIAVLLEHRYFRLRRGLAGQLDRAGVSISSTIAEGFERDGTPSLITYMDCASRPLPKDVDLPTSAPP